MTEIKFEIVKTLAVLSTSEKGWSKELNLVSWNERPAKYDLREWSPDHQVMSKGITLSLDEMKALRAAIDGLDL